MAKYYKYDKQPGSDIRGILVIEYSLNAPQKAGDALLTALGTGKADAITREDLVQWGTQTVKAGHPLLAVSIGLDSQKAGFDIPNSQIQEWELSCYEEKTPSEVVHNAISLIETYRNILDDQQNLQMAAKVEESFKQVLPEKETLRVEDTLSMDDALVKIRNLLFSEPAN